MSQLFANFGVDWKLLVAQVVNFAILFYLLKRFAYQPILAMLQKREDLVRKGLEDAEAAGRELQSVHTEAKSIHADAKKEAHALLLEAQSEGHTLVEEARREGEVTKNAVIYSAQREIEENKRASELAVSKKLAEYVVMGIKALLAEEVTSEMNSRMIAKLTQKN